MYMMLKIAKSFRVCSSQLENNIFRSREICVCAFYFFVVVALFLSMFSLGTEYLFVRLTEPGKSLSAAFEKKVLLCRFTVLKIKQ